jgi:L-fucose mutarotase
MLKNIDPLLSPELLGVLAAMGHGDDLAVVDANFPADSVARRTCHGRVVTLAGASMPEAVAAIVSVLPLDEFVDAPVRAMAAPNTAAGGTAAGGTTGDGPAAGGTGGEPPEVQREVQAVIDQAAGRHWPIVALERFAFYEAARCSYAVVLTGERRYYGNVLIKKGALPPAQ